MTWYFQYVLARDIAAARQAEASRSSVAHLAKAHADEHRHHSGPRPRTSPARRTIAAAVAALGAQTRRLARRLDVDSASEFDVQNVTRIRCDGESERA